MAIEIHCPNGHRIKVKEHLAGRTGRCPTCGTTVRVEVEPSLPLARLVPVDPAILATLPRARPLGAGARAERERQAPVSAGLPSGETGPLPTETGDFAGWDSGPAEPRWDVPEPGGAARDPAGGTPQPESAAAPQPAPFEPPIAERPDLTWCIAFPGGDPTEPLDAPTMQAWLDGGHATGTEVVWRSDWPEWRTVQDVFPRFFSGGFRV